MKKRIRYIFFLFFILFAVIVLNLGKMVFIDSENLSANAYNKRMSIVDDNTKRGEIVSADGLVLAESEGIYGGGFNRIYPYNNVFCHTVGVLGKMGIESKYNFTLQKINNEFLQRISQLLTDKTLNGNKVILTINSGLQQFVFDKLTESGLDGAVVVLDSETGKILAICAVPNFDANATANEWKDLSNDANSPILNRAAQGLYPPGSTFKIITAAAAIDILEYENITYDCSGTAVFGENKIRCSGGTAHGVVDLEKALVVSCNGFFASLSEQVNPNDLRRIAENFGFNNSLQYELDYTISSFSLSASSNQKEILDTYFGQGKTTATPLQMALCAAAIINGGLIMKPYVVDRVESESGYILETKQPVELIQAISVETADILKEMLIGAVERGTGKTAQVQGLKIGGKTGTAQNAGGDDHSWFVCYVNEMKPRAVISILLENTGGGSKATNMANQILSYMQDNDFFIAETIN